MFPNLATFIDIIAGIAPSYRTRWKNETNRTLRQKEGI
jgi:hypothetical protein